MTTTVVKHTDDYDVFIGRPSRWGNPFKVGYLSREDAIARYRAWVVTQVQLMADLDQLKGKRLGCFCKPLACHGDFLSELIDMPNRDLFY